MINRQTKGPCLTHDMKMTMGIFFKQNEHYTICLQTIIFTT